MNRTILLVEDNASDEKLTLLAFKRCGIPGDIVVARDGAEALEHLIPARDRPTRDAAPLPALVLLDLKLPKVDGLEVLRRVREDERTRLVPVVVLTASREREDVLRSLSLGANAYVGKPVELTELTEFARTVSLFWLVLNEPMPTGGPSR